MQYYKKKRLLTVAWHFFHPPCVAFLGEFQDCTSLCILNHTSDSNRHSEVPWHYCT